MKLVSGIVDSGFFAQSALSAEVATKDSLGRNISETYLTGVDLTPYQTTADMVNYQTTAGMTAYQEAGEYYSASNPSGFLVADDITGKLDASVYAADSGSFLTAVPETYLQNTDLEISDNKITGISGIPLSAGGDVPEGVMVESGLEYNAVQEISGYNGSAIAQYGAEKQWLVHDDTLVHVANSAQYALGVNLSAVAQLLGVDRTVLFEIPYSASTAQSIIASGNITLTESLLNFDRCEIYWAPWGSYGEKRFEPLINICPIVEGSYIPICGHWVVENNGGTFDFYNILSATGNKLYHIEGRFWTPTATSMAGPDSNFKLFKVIGIGRKQ